MQMVYTRLSDEDRAKLDAVAEKNSIKRATLVRLILVDALRKGITLKHDDEPEPKRPRERRRRD